MNAHFNRNKIEKHRMSLEKLFQDRIIQPSPADNIASRSNEAHPTRKLVLPQYFEDEQLESHQDFSIDYNEIGKKSSPQNFMAPLKLFYLDT